MKPCVPFYPPHTIGRNNQRRKEWQAKGLEPGADRGADAGNDALEKLMEAATAVTIGRVQQGVRWRISRAFATTDKRVCDRCTSTIQSGTPRTTFTDTSSQEAEVVTHSRCEDRQIRNIGGEEKLMQPYPHEIGFGVPLEEIVEGSLAIPGISGSRFEEKPVGGGDYAVFCSKEVLDLLQAQRGELFEVAEV